MKISFLFFDNFIDSAVKTRIYQLQLLVLKVLVCCTGFAHLELNCLLFIASTRLRPSNLQFEAGRSPHQLPVQFRFLFKILMITFKSLNGLSRCISFSVLMHVSVSSGHFMKRYTVRFGMTLWEILLIAISSEDV